MTLPSKLPQDFVNQLKKQILFEEQKRAAYRAENKRLRQQSLMASVTGMQNNGWVEVYTNQVPYELDILRGSLYQKSDIGWFIRTVLGVGVGNQLFAVGFDCQPISPPGLSVTVGPGVIYYFDLLLPTPYSVIPADTNPDHQIYKSYISFDTQTFATPAPVTPGNTIIYLIQGANETQEANIVNRPYYNDANPSMPIYESQADTVLNFTNLGVKAGVAAPSPTPPTPDAGYTALYYVTVAYGETSIISGDITVVPGAPFVTESLTQKISSATVSSDFVTKAQEQKSTNVYSADIGTPNVIVVNPTPAYTAYVSGTTVSALIANTNTGPATLNISGQGAIAINIITPDGLVPLVGDEIQAGAIHQFIHNGTVFILLNTAGGSSDPDFASLGFNMATTQVVLGGGGGISSKVLLNRTISDSSSLISTNGFLPYAGRWSFDVITTFDLYIGGLALKLYKNGSLLFQYGVLQTSTTSSASISGNFEDLANGTDQYDLYLSVGAGDSAHIGNGSDGHLVIKFSAQYIRGN